MEEIPWEELDDEQKEFWGNKEAYLAAGPAFRQKLKEHPEKGSKKEKEDKCKK